MMNSMMKGMMNSMSPDEKQGTMLKLMPEMMKRIKGSEIMELISGQISEMMFVTHQSKFGFEKTLQEIKAGGESFGWYRPDIMDRKELEKNFDYADSNPVGSVSMCIPRKAYEILKVNKKLAAMMPMQIAVYEENGKVYISWMNIKMMGKMFGEKVSSIMGTASDDLHTVLKDIIVNEEGE